MRFRRPVGGAVGVTGKAANVVVEREADVEAVANDADELFDVVARHVVARQPVSLEKSYAVLRIRRNLREKQLEEENRKKEMKRNQKKETKRNET